MASDDFLSRWSRRKTEARQGMEPLPEAPVAPVSPSGRDLAPPAAIAPATQLPPVESLTPESDFQPFMAPEVDATLRRDALKTLFRDPRFNVMDMMDVYVDDYSKPDPLPEGWLEKMEQVSRLGDRPERDRAEAARLAAEEAAAKAGAEGSPGNPDAVPGIEAAGESPPEAGLPPSEAPGKSAADGEDSRARPIPPPTSGL